MLFRSLLLVAAYGHTSHAQIRSVHQIAPGVFTRIGDRDARQPANTSWIEFRNFVVVIEANTPWGLRDILPEIRKTTSKPIRYVFDTHYHWDHTQGNSMMADEGVTVVCSQDCASELAVKGKTEWDQMSKNAEYSLAPYRLQQPSVVFGDFMAIDDGERRVELRRVGPAHTIGDAVAFLPKEGVLFTGDLCVNWKSGNNVGDRDADHQHWVQVLNDLARWNVKTVVPGHGELGTVATLRLTFAGGDFEDTVQVVRCQEIKGAAVYQVGTTFLTTAAPSVESLRYLIRRESGRSSGYMRLLRKD